MRNVLESSYFTFANKILKKNSREFSFLVKLATEGQTFYIKNDHLHNLFWRIFASNISKNGFVVLRTPLNGSFGLPNILEPLTFFNFWLTYRYISSPIRHGKLTDGQVLNINVTVVVQSIDSKNLWFTYR